MTHKFITRSTIMIFLGMCLLMPKLRLSAEASEISAEDDMVIGIEETEAPCENIVLETEELATEEYPESAGDFELSAIETVPVSDTETGTIIATGKSGYANWTYDSEGVLTFFPDNLSGPMKDYNYQTTLPDYDDYAEQVKKIVIKDGVTTIGKMAFYRCRNATEIQIGDSVKKIGADAFSGKYTDIYIPAKVESIDDYCTYEKFNGYIVSAENAYYSSDERGVLFNKDKTILLHAPGNLEGTYSIPETVTEIAHPGFGSCQKLLNLIIGNGITKISFLGTSLETVTIGKDVEMTDTNPFLYQGNLKSIIVSEENENYLSVDGVLYNKTGTQLIAYPRAKAGECKVLDGVVEIRTDALESGTFNKLVLPESVSGDLVCKNCNNLKEIIFSNQITALDCSGCAGLESIEIPDYITEFILQDCTGLKQVRLPSNVKSISQSIFKNCSSLVEINFPEGLETIEKMAFENCSGLLEISFPESLITIDSSAFKNCSSLSEIAFPMWIRDLGYACFGNCSSLSKITFSGKTPDTIQNDAFTGVIADCYYPSNHLTWNDSTKLDYGGTLNWIEYEIDEFEEIEAQYHVLDTNITLIYKIDTETSEIEITNCNTDAEGNLELPSVIEGKRVSSIGKSAFLDCTGLTGITVPESIKIIEESAFKNCTGLVNIQLFEGLTEIGDSAFMDCTSLASALIPDSVASIGSAAFQGCKKMTDVKLPDGITTIHENTFLNTGLTSCSIPDTVTTIENCAFKNTRITEITVPKSVSVMGTEIFAGNWQLKKVTLENGIQEIPEQMFYSCYNLLDVVFPNTLKKIEASAFRLCVSLNSVVLPEGLTSIGVSAFCGCGSCDLYSDMDSDNFTSVVLPSTLTEIGRDAFGLCQSLRSITIPKSVTRIEASTFRSCYRLESVILPATCTYIGDRAFLQCKRLQTVTFQWTAPQIDSDAFSSTTATCYYPSNNDAWTTSMLQNYGGTLTWVAKEMINSGTDGTDIPDQDGKVNVSLDNQTSQSGNGSGSGGASVTPPENGWKEGSNTFSIACTQPCVALLSTDGGKTYTRLKVVKNTEGSYNCTADNMTENAILSVLLLGDINGDGKVSNSDVTAGKAVVMEVNSVGTLRQYAADLNGDGEITNNDITRLKAVILGKSELSW